MSSIEEEQTFEKSEIAEDQTVDKEQRNLARRIVRFLTFILGVGLTVYVIIRWHNRLGGDSTTNAPPPKKKRGSKRKS